MSRASLHAPVREDWLGLRQEEILEPARPIIDPHHHLWDRPGARYLFPELLADMNAGHDVRATVYIQCRSMYRASGPEELRPVGAYGSNRTRRQSSGRSCERRRRSGAR